MTLKFGLLFAIRNPRQWRKSWAQVYAETIEQVQAAEELGFDSVWMSEHHGADDGYCPSTLMMAGVAATHTKRITVGTRLLLLPLHHPVRVAEDAAVADVLSNGRFILGMPERGDARTRDARRGDAERERPERERPERERPERKDEEMSAGA
ncbi:MAG: LLM class flavin-dependent oxidoreductase [Chloroflexi bacterium]|nr:LLM class flavin-dependent oxidoreductase [Chloroflexota bacterium]